jgi:hypothetical protein
MSDAYTNQVFNSDLDAFKQTGIKTGQVTFSGSLGAGQERMLYTDPISLDGLDFAQILFDNSFYHNGRFRNLALENATMIYETTQGSELQCNVGQVISGNTVRLSARLFNPYSTAVNLSTTIIHFQYVPYQSTI